MRPSLSATAEDRHTPACLAAPLWPRAAAALSLGAFFATVAFAGKGGQARTADEEFGRDVELAPFVVRGEQLAISIHARSARDRRYAEAFAEDVVKVVYDAVTEHTGKGLVIIGAKGEPHPIAIFQKFEAMAEAGDLQPDVAARRGELRAFVEAWRNALDQNRARQVANEAGEADPETAASPEKKNHVDVDLEFEEVVSALPLPLDGLGAKLYQIGWAERFDEAKLDARLRTLRSEDLDGDGFAKFDWVFYLPARGVFDRVLNDVIQQALKESDMGFFTRMAARTILVAAKPTFRRFIEGMRKGMLFMTLVRTRTEFSPDEASAVSSVYIMELMPGAEKKRQGSEYDRAVAAVREVVAGLRCAAHAAAAGETLEPDAAAVLDVRLAAEDPAAETAH